MIKLEATVFLQTQFLLLATSNFIVDNFLLTLVFGNFVIFMIFLQTFTLFYDFFSFFPPFSTTFKKILTNGSPESISASLVFVT